LRMTGAKSKDPDYASSAMPPREVLPMQLERTPYCGIYAAAILGISRLRAQSSSSC
jgi:hypothetical protein